MKGKLLTYVGAPGEVLWFDLLGNKKDATAGLFQVIAITLIFWGLVAYWAYKRKWGLVLGMIGLAFMAFTKTPAMPAAGTNTNGEAP